jgi:hypothetical protein
MAALHSLTLTVEHASKVLGVGRSTAYPPGRSTSTTETAVPDAAARASLNTPASVVAMWNDIY